MIEIKYTKKISVAFTEGKGLNNFDEEESKLKVILKKNGIKTEEHTIGIFYNSPDKVGAENVRWDACIPVPENTNAENIKVKKLESAKGASIVHLGPFDTLGDSFRKIFSWISEKGHKVTGPVREIYIKKSMTEIQIPIE